MATLTFTMSDEDVERIADRVVEKMQAKLKDLQPAKPPLISNHRLLLTRVEAANALGFSLRTFDRVVKRGLLPRNLVTGRLMFSVKDLEKLVAETMSDSI